jgi:organic radical activating enzyme/CRISPR/Cas system CSM-associated protein Csm2 small subunit
MSKGLFDWRKRVLDSVSPSFCAAKWLNATIHLGHGMTHSCHLPIPHPIDKEEIKTNPSALHNTAHKKKQRERMIKGERPPECEYCWKIEDIGRDNISDRVYKSQIYKEKDIIAISENDPYEDVIPKTLEISFDRTCNLACSYCNSSYSTTWAQDIKKNGPYQQMKSDGAGAYHHDGEWTEPYGKFNEGNPYVEAFFKWWPQLSSELEELRITGGEALVSHQFWNFAKVVKQNHAPNLRIAINSNLMVKDDLIQDLVDFTKLDNYKEFDLFTSCEATGLQADYIRDVLEYNTWKDNLEYVISNGRLRCATIMMTITSLSLFSITEFLDDMAELKAKYAPHKPAVDLNILRWPSFMSPLALPDHIKNHCREKLEAWSEENKLNPLFNPGERAQIQRLIDYIEVVDKPHRRTTEDKDKLQHDFKSFYAQYDKRRGKDIGVFPKILTDWLDTIDLDNTIPVIEMHEGSITHYDD